MKLTITLGTVAAAATLLTANVATAQVHYSSEHNTTYVESHEYNNVFMLIAVDPRANCEPKMIIRSLYDDGSNRAETYVDFDARIDRREPWEIDDASMTVVDGKEDIVTNTNERFINELRRGTTLRTKFSLKRGGYTYYSFGLMGFSRAYSKAKAACKPNSGYFSSSSDNELYL